MNREKTKLAQLLYDLMYPIRTSEKTSASRHEEAYHKICHTSFYDDLGEEIICLANEAISG